jgi:hypothetical protein
VAGSSYLQVVGPFYGFFRARHGALLRLTRRGHNGLLLAGVVRMVVAVAGGFLLLRWSANLTLVFAATGFALLIFGLTIAGAVAGGVWFRGRE